MDKARSSWILLIGILAMLAPLTHAAESFGYSRIKLERTWIVHDAKGVQIELHGALSVNNSYQQIVSVTTDPPMEQEMKDGVLWVTYNGTPDSDNFTIRGTVIADIDYDPKISSDGPMPLTQLNASNLTMWDENISSMATSLADDQSQLKTIRAITGWVHDNMTYDVNYWGKSISAREVFQERRGVCVEYTHLLISMARSLGFDTKYVSGYIYQDGWQQHAWAEIDVPGFGWLPADATFGQVGVLDNTHFGIHYGQDQSDTYDTLTATSESVSLDAVDTPTVMLQTTDPKGVQLTMNMDPETYVADVTLTNNRPYYAFGAYSFEVPQNYGADFIRHPPAPAGADDAQVPRPQSLPLRSRILLQDTCHRFLQRCQR